MLDHWVYQPGLPANAARPIRRPSPQVDAAVRAFAGGGTVDPRRLGRAGPRPSGCASSTACRSELPRRASPRSTARLGLSQSGNTEVLFAWLQLALANRYEPAVPAAERFLTAMGRRKFVRRCSRR